MPMSRAHKEDVRSHDKVPANIVHKEQTATHDATDPDCHMDPCPGGMSLSGKGMAMGHKSNSKNSY